MEKHIVTEKNEDITSLRIEVYEINSYYGTSRNIGTHFIDLEKQKIVSENKNEVIKTTEGDIITQQEAKKILEDLYYDARQKYLGVEFEYKKEERTIEYNFIIKKINGKWLVDEYTNVWF